MKTENSRRIHIRRTDHGFEAPFRQVREYMELIQEWFDKRNVTDKKRVVYIATDEPSVFYFIYFFLFYLLFYFILFR